jgi:hypothetical protein
LLDRRSTEREARWGRCQHVMARRTVERMAEIKFDDDRLSALIADAVRELLAKEQSRVGKLSDGFLDEAAKTERELVKQIEDSRDRFEGRARERLKAADGVIEEFEKAVAEKKKKVDDMLSVKLLAGFSALLLIISLVALSYLGDRITTVNSKVKEYSDAAKKLDDSRGQLELAMTNAAKVYKDATQAGDAGTPMQALTALVTRIDADVTRIDASTKRIDGDLGKLKKDVAPVVEEYVARHRNK